MAANDPRQIPLYHFTHVRHLASMVGTNVVCDTDARTSGVMTVEVGDRSVKDLRRRRTVTVDPGGVVADYVPFYFAPRSPMLYSIWKGNVPEYQDGEDALVYLVSDIGSVSYRGLAFAFTEGNAASAITEFFDDLEDLDCIDWAIMEEKYWNDTLEDGDRMRRRMAEFLVHRALPWETISEIGVKTDDIAEDVSEILDTAGAEVSVVVRREWYYG